MKSFKEWLSDYLRYFILLLALVLAVGVIVLGVKLYQSTAGSRQTSSNPDDIVILNETETDKKDGQTEAKTEAGTEAETQTESRKGVNAKPETEETKPEEQTESGKETEKETEKETKKETETEKDTEKETDKENEKVTERITETERPAATEPVLETEQAAVNAGQTGTDDGIHILSDPGERQNQGGLAGQQTDGSGAAQTQAGSASGSTGETSVPIRDDIIVLEEGAGSGIPGTDRPRRERNSSEDAAETQTPETQAPQTEPQTEAPTEPPEPVYLTMTGTCYMRSYADYGDNIIGEYPAGTVVEFLEDVGGWYKVQIDGMVGYMGARFF